jgi:type I restriction-modification system, S subunit
MMNGKQLKNSILQWAIQGKLVPQDPNDEPASVLLKKIRAEKARLIKEGKIKKDKKESIIYRGEDNSYYRQLSSHIAA